MGEVLQDEWSGLYKESWTGVICPESFSHPAKFSRALIRKIYDHVIEEGWAEKGSRVIDPFGGVALGGIDAMRHGLHFIGVELEEKFVNLGNQNIALWNERYSRMPNWGTAQLLQGDSRKLSTILDKAELIASSPPYANQDLGGGDDQRKMSGSYSPEQNKATKKGKGLHGNYGRETEGQLGAMREGSLDLAVASPPYVVVSPEKSSKGVDYQKQYETYRSQGGGASFEKFVATQELHSQGYGVSDGQLSQMKAGDHALAISSPPYVSGGHHPDQTGAWGGQAQANTKDQAGYGRTDGQMGQMKEGDLSVAISSPPYIESLKPETEEQTRKKQERIARSKTIYDGRKLEEPSAGKAGLGGGYGTTEGNLGAMPPGELCITSPPYEHDTEPHGDLRPDDGRQKTVFVGRNYGGNKAQIGISSPPYPQPHTGGGGINIKGYRNDKQRPRSEAKPFDLVGQRSYQSKGADRSEGNLETMDAGGFECAVSSPPWESTDTVSHSGLVQKWCEQSGRDPQSACRVATVDGYGTSQGQIGNQRGETFWSASRITLEQLYQVLAPGAHAVFVVKAFVRNKTIVDFPGQWAQLCEAVGFKLLHDHHALLTEHYGTQGGFDEDKELSVARKSFFRRLHEKKHPGTEINWENILCFVKPA